LIPVEYTFERDAAAVRAERHKGVGLRNKQMAVRICRYSGSDTVFETCFLMETWLTWYFPWLRTTRGDVVLANAHTVLWIRCCLRLVEHRKISVLAVFSLLIHEDATSTHADILNWIDSVRPHRGCKPACHPRIRAGLL